jgi:hypothetical protein
LLQVRIGIEDHHGRSAAVLDRQGVRSQPSQQPHSQPSGKQFGEGGGELDILFAV